MVGYKKKLKFMGEEAIKIGKVLATNGNRL
jgi:hypothetical protein